MKDPAAAAGTPKGQVNKFNKKRKSEGPKAGGSGGNKSVPAERKSEPAIKAGTSSSASEDPDLSQVSAYAVFNNLVPGLKAYQDTSQPAKRRNKKKNRRKANQANGGDQKEAQSPAKGGSSHDGNNSSNNNELPVANGVKLGKKKRIQPLAVDKEGRPVNAIPETQGTGTETSSASGSVAEDSPRCREKSKKRKRKSKKKPNAAETTEDEVTVIEKKSNPREANEPPNKMRKVDNKSKLLPNPLAVGFNGASLENMESESGDSSATDKKKKKRQRKKSQQKGTLEIQDLEKKSPKEDKNKALVPLGSEPDHTYQNDDCPEIQSLMNSKVVNDSVEHGKKLFEWLIYPESLSGFMQKHWEKRPLLVKRGQLYPEYYEWIFSSAKFDDILRRNVLKFSKNIDVVSYENGERVTVSEDMTHRVRPAVLWDYYQTGNSIRLLNPQTYCSPLRRLNASLQEMFGTFVGANVYLTPPDSQGFAPHWDDIEAFVLQLEGKKQWKLYKPRNSNEVLSRFSSKDFGQEEDSLELLMSVVLEPGDLLYFPRGVIHQAKTVDGFHSMHITVSCYQQNSWADLLKQHFAKTVDLLAAKDVDFRQGLPMDYLSYMGLAASQVKTPETLHKRSEFKEKLKKLVKKVGEVDADAAADEMGKKFIWDALPPVLTKKEVEKTVVEDGEFLISGSVKNRVEFDPDTKVRLVRKHCARLVAEEGVLKLYFSTENPLVYHEEEPQFVEIASEFQSAVEQLLNSYPEYVRIEELAFDSNDLEKKVQIASDLWERGILMTESPLEAGDLTDADGMFDEDDSEEQDSELDDFIVGDDEVEHDEERDELDELDFGDAVSTEDEFTTSGGEEEEEEDGEDIGVNSFRRRRIGRLDSDSEDDDELPSGEEFLYQVQEDDDGEEDDDSDGMEYGSGSEDEEEDDSSQEGSSCRIEELDDDEDE